MKQNFLLEITVESVEAALAAERAGADRIELCADLNSGGVTPTAETMRKFHAALRIPVYTMIRPRAGNFVYTSAEVAAMKREILIAKESKMDGVVFGLLRADGAVDIETSKELVEFARPLPVTFHRAFDVSADLGKSLEAVISTGAVRILTSGGAHSAPEGALILRSLVEAAGQRIIIMPGAGIRPDNFAEVRRATAAREFHAGLGSVLPYGATDYTKFESQVRAMTQQKLPASS
jgi:copper homeostasis protein